MWLLVLGYYWICCIVLLYVLASLSKVKTRWYHHLQVIFLAPIMLPAVLAFALILSYAWRE